MVFGIGNPLIDVVIRVTDSDLDELGLSKGIMHLVTLEEQSRILDHLAGLPRMLRPGGSAPNTMLALAGLGVEAVISGKIGDDEFGATYCRQVADYGITSRLVVGDGATGSSVILVTPDGERTMNTHLGMCQQFGAQDVDDELLRSADYLYFTGYMWDTEVQKAAIIHAIEVARASGAKVAFDVADPFAVERYRDDFRALIRDHVDLVFANRREAALLYGAADGGTAGTGSADAPGGAAAPGASGAADPMAEAEACARALGGHVETAIVKAGKDGSVLWHRGEITRTPGRPIQPTDTTGAGDMFSAGFLAGLATGRTPPESARLAGHLAEEIITRPGAQFGIEEIRKLRKELFGAEAFAAN